MRDPYEWLDAFELAARLDRERSERYAAEERAASRAAAPLLALVGRGLEDLAGRMSEGYARELRPVVDKFARDGARAMMAESVVTFGQLDYADSVTFTVEMIKPARMSFAVSNRMVTERRRP